MTASPTIPRTVRLAPRAPRTRRRRRWPWILLTAITLVPLVLAGVGAWAYGAADVDTVGSLDFATPLRVPPVLDGEQHADGTVHYPLELAPTSAQLVSGQPTELWGVNGTSPGPTLRMRRGETVAMDVTNSLPETSTVHWHGMHLPAAADGGPHQPVSPGGSWQPSWVVDQPATTLWYHPHLHGQTEEHVKRGVVGMILVEDGETGLPTTYGVDDIPVVLQDLELDGSGQLRMSQLGDTIAVNGTVDPHLDVTTSIVRLRLLNASSHRQYDIGFDDRRAVTLVATDGGFLPEPVDLSSIPLSPGERAEVVVRLSPGERSVLRSEPPDLGTNFLAERFAGGDDRFDLLQLRAAPELTEPAGRTDWPPAPTTTAEGLGHPVAQRTFELSGREINGTSMDMDRIDFAVPVDTTEDWTVTNADGSPHLPRPRHAVPCRERRRRRAAGASAWTEGHDRRAAEAVDRGAGPVRGLPRSRRPLHGPLPPARPRGCGHDASVRGGRAGPTTRHAARPHHIGH